MSGVLRGGTRWESAITGEDEELQWVLLPGGLCQLSERVYHPMRGHWSTKGTVVLSWDALCALADEITRLRQEPPAEGGVRR